MKIGKNELEIMGLLDENEGMEKDTLRKKFGSDQVSTASFSRALSSLTRKSLVAKYAQISEERPNWEFVSWTKDRFGNDAVLMKKPYDGKMSEGPITKIFLGLTEKGRKELRRRQGQAPD